MNATPRPPGVTMDVSNVRLHVLRGAFLLVTIGLAGLIGPQLLNPPANVSHMTSVVWSLLGGVGLLAVIGVRHPLKMLPVLIFEMLWKVVWLLVFGIPLWRSGQLSGANAQTFAETMFGVVLALAVIPWPYVVKHYLRAPAVRGHA